MKEIYLDNAATTKPIKAAVDAAVFMMQNEYGNPSSRHSKGFEAEKIIKSARKSAADKPGAKPESLIFTSGGSESNNLAIFGFLKAQREKKKIITTKIEHKSVLNPFHQLEEEGYEVSYIGTDGDGRIKTDELEAELSASPVSLVSVMHVNNDVGTIQPINEIFDLAHQYGAVLHVDGVQGFCKIPDKVKFDFYSFSAHKIGAVKGCGGLFVADGVKLKPVIYGGGQEKAMRSGTENTVAIASLGAVCEQMNVKESFEKVKILNNEMRKLAIGEILSPEDASPYILNVAFRGLKSEVLLNALSQKGIFVSSGSACSSNRPEHNHVLTAMGKDAKLIDSSIRISFNPYMAIDDIKEARACIEQTASELIKIMRIR